MMEDNLKCHIKGLEAYRFATNGMKALANVLQSEGEKVGYHDDVYDWARILFHPEIRGLGATIEALNQLATKMNAPFVFWQLPLYRTPIASSIRGFSLHITFVLEW